MPDHAPMNSTTPAASPAHPASTGQPALPGQDVSPLVRALSRVRARAWTLLVFSGLVWVLGVAMAVATALAVADFYLRTPPTLRTGLLVVGIIGLWTLVRSRIMPALRFRPSLTEVALRIEQTPQGAAAGLTGALASGLELSSSRELRTTDQLRRTRAVTDAVERFQRSPGSIHILRPAYAGKALAAALALMLPALTLSAVRPELSRIGALRVLLPWSDVSWPKRTLLADLTGVTVHSSQASLPLRAIVHHDFSQTPDVWVRFRTLVDGAPGAWRSELLTAQGKRATSQSGILEGDLVERLIEPSASAPERAGGESSVTELQYRFETSDDQTDVAKIRLVNPPIVLRSEIEVTPPPYAVAASTPGSAVAYVSGAQPVAEGVSATSIGPVLAGSMVNIRAAFNKHVPGPAAGVASMFVGPQPRAATINDEGSGWSLGFTPDSSIRVVLLPQDEFGIASPTETVLSISVIADQPPTAAILTPAQDEGVLPTATLSIDGEGRDDVGLDSTAIESVLVPAAAGSQGAPAKPADPTVLAKSVSTPAAKLGPQTRVSAALNLGDLGAKPGDEITLSTLAQDVYDRDGERHAVVRSAGRKLFVISEAQFVEQVQNELAAVRDAAMRLDQDQHDLTAKASQQTLPQQVAAQRSLTQRLTPPAELVDRLSKRIERNGLSDQAMSGMLKDAQESLRAAAKASEEASEALSQADRKSAAGEDPKDDAQAAAKSQGEVREELASLVGMLDRGQDGWTVRREVQKLLEQQRDLTQQTRDATARVAGKPAESLTPAERQKLQSLSQAQQDLSARTQDAIQELDTRAKAMEKNDPGQSAAMKQAAERGREQKVAENQRQAAQAINENRSQSANELQEKAQEAMQEMLQRFDQSQRQRDDALRRVLAELVDQIRGLIVQQKAQLEGLAQAQGAITKAGLDVPMIALHTATLGVVDGVSGGGKSPASDVAEPIAAAAQAQSRAIEELRAPEPKVEPVRENEQASLASLESALELARKLDQQAQQRDEQRQRAEMLEAYKAALELQVAIGVDTQPIAGKTLDRRLRAAARALGEREESLRATLEELRKKNAGIEDTIVFSYAHDQMDVMLRRCVESLRGGAVPPSLRRDQDSVVALLKSLVQAMASSQQEDPFREGADEGDEQQQGGDGSPGAGGAKPKLIPEVAELQGLRGLQEIVAIRTRAAAEAGAQGDASELKEIQKFQRDIADRAKTLQERLKNGGGGARPQEEAPGDAGGAGEQPKGDADGERSKDGAK